MNFNQDESLHETPLTRSEEGVALDIHCPSCLESLSVKTSECPGCGILFSQFHRVAFERKIKALIPGLHHLSSYDCDDLKKAWGRVEAVYSDTESHHEFIHRCYKLKAFPFAIKMYDDRIERDPDDGIADIMRFRTLTLCQETLPAKALGNQSVKNQSSMLFRLFNFVFRAMGLFGTILFLSSFFIGNSGYYMGLGFFLLTSGLIAAYFVQSTALDGHFNRI